MAAYSQPPRDERTDSAKSKHSAADTDFLDDLGLDLDLDLAPSKHLEQDPANSSLDLGLEPEESGLAGLSGLDLDGLSVLDDDDELDIPLGHGDDSKRAASSGLSLDLDMLDGLDISPTDLELTDDHARNTKKAGDSGLDLGGFDLGIDLDDDIDLPLGTADDDSEVIALDDDSDVIALDDGSELELDDDDDELLDLGEDVDSRLVPLGLADDDYQLEPLSYEPSDDEFTLTPLGEGEDEVIALDVSPDASKDVTYDDDPIEEGDRNLRDAIGVTENSLHNWESRCKEHITRITNSRQFIVDRPLHTKVGELLEVLDEIMINCQQDPEDIREEIGLPPIIDRLARNVEEYVHFAPRGLLSAKVRERLGEAAELVEKAIPELRALLERMRNNDGDHISNRAKVMSRIFDREP